MRGPAASRPARREARGASGCSPYNGKDAAHTRAVIGSVRCTRGTDPSGELFAALLASTPTPCHVCGGGPMLRSTPQVAPFPRLRRTCSDSDSVLFGGKFPPVVARKPGGSLSVRCPDFPGGPIRPLDVGRSGLLGAPNERTSYFRGSPLRALVGSEQPERPAVPNIRGTPARAQRPGTGDAPGGEVTMP